MKKKLCLILICLSFLACGKLQVIDRSQSQERNMMMGNYYFVD
ncbi:MAG: hypothetical protein ACRC0V_07300 [Fusobacteriaceae bacterium]